MKKRGYEFSFAWLFTIIVGATVIFLAIYIATQITQIKQFEEESAEAKHIGILLTPVETNLEEGKFARIILGDETKIINDCINQTNSNPFGSQQIGVSIKPSFGKEWTELSGVESTFHNKYIFSNRTLQGKDNFYVLSKPLNLPFKVADLIMIWSDKDLYCFDIGGAPEIVAAELEDLNMTNVIIKSSSCPDGSVKVCFHTGSDCDINVGTVQGIVTKNGQNVYYVKSFGADKYGLMYAAIFSDPDIYNCQVKRLMAHASYLSDVYKLKSAYFMSIARNTAICSTATMQLPLETYKDAANETADILTSSNLINVRSKAEEVDTINEPLQCKLF